MWLVGSAQVRVAEYSSVDVDTLGTVLAPVREEYVSISPWSFTHSIVRSQITVRIGELRMTEAFALSIRAIAELQAFVFVHGGALRMRMELLERTRDSSRTALKGNLGQGMLYFLLLRRFGSHGVVDFGAGCGRIGVLPPGADDRRPDYLCSADGWQSLTVAESKGTECRDPATFDGTRNNLYKLKANMKEGLAQCASGRSRLARPAASIAAVTLLATSATGAGTEVRWCDPIDGDPEPISEGARASLARLHYAAWAASIGLLDFASWLMGDADGRPPPVPGRQVGDRGRHWFVPDTALWPLMLESQWPSAAVEWKVWEWLQRPMDPPPRVEPGAVEDDGDHLSDGTGFIRLTDRHQR